MFVTGKVKSIFYSFLKKESNLADRYVAATIHTHNAFTFFQVEGIFCCDPARGLEWNKAFLY